MLTGQKRHQVDAIWDTIHAGGIANPIQVIEQLTYLLFLKRLDENQLAAEENAQLLGTTPENPTFSVENRALRWHVLKQRDPADIFEAIRDKAFPFIKTLGGENSTLSRHMNNAIFLWPNAGLLARVVEMLDGIEMNDADTKGDLYEYMLAKLSQGGQNGQFRTPRHIIAAMVEMTSPRPSDIICDPACGTAGFLVLAGEYLRKHHESLFYDESQLRHFHDSTFYGMDFDATMLRIAAMNMTLHGVENPNILPLDALSGDNTQRELYTLILANPPFAGSLDKSGVAKDLTYAVNTSKTELLFLALFLRLLKPGGRAAVIVPDGVLFGASNAHKTLRETLVNKHKLDAVVSLPSGVFKPYAGVSTAILFFTKTGAGGTGDVWFYDLKADGFSLDDKRQPIEANDIPDLLKQWKTRHELKFFVGGSEEVSEEGVRSGELGGRRGELPEGLVPSSLLPPPNSPLLTPPSQLPPPKPPPNSLLSNSRTGKHFLVPRDEIAGNGYDLSLNRYKQVIYEQIAHESPAQLLAELQTLEADIQSGLGLLSEMIGSK